MVSTQLPKDGAGATRRRPSVGVVLAFFGLGLGLLAMASAAPDARAARIFAVDEGVDIRGHNFGESVLVSLFSPGTWRVRVLGNPLTDYREVRGCESAPSDGVVCPQGPRVL